MGPTRPASMGAPRRRIIEQALAAQSAAKGKGTPRLPVAKPEERIKAKTMGTEDLAEALSKVRTKSGHGLPDVNRHMKGLSFERLMKKQPPYIRSKALDVVVRKLSKTKTKTGVFDALVGVTRDINVKPMCPHKFSIINLDPDSKKFTASRKVKVSCDCEFFMYHCEFALWTWGAASIRYCNGEPANFTNPGNHPLVCKHLQKVLTTIVQSRL